MYRSQDSDNGPTPVQASRVPEAQPINQAELTELQRAEAEIPASPPPAAAPRDPAAPTSGAPGAAASPATPRRARRRWFWRRDTTHEVATHAPCPITVLHDDEPSLNETLFY